MTNSTLLLASVVAFANAPASKTVSLLPTSFEGELEEHWKFDIGKRIGDGFSQGDFRLVSGDALGPDAAGCTDPGCLTSVATSTKSDLMVLSSVTVVEKDYEIAMTVVDGTNGSTLATVEDTCGLCGAQEAAEMASDLASTLRSKLDAMAKAQPSLLVSSDPPGANVKLDGQLVGTTPMQVELDAGKHNIVFERDGYVTEERSLTAVAGVRDRINIALTAAKRDWRKGAWIGGWVLIGTGVAGLGAGSTLLAIHDRPYRTDCEADADGDCRNLYNTQLGGIIGVSVGAVAAIAGVALVTLSRKNRRGKSSRRAQLIPSLGGLAGRF